MVLIPPSERHWSWNGDAQKPTFSPSILVTGLQCEIKDHRWTGDYVRGPDGQALPSICHSFVAEGMIQFLDDCTHRLKGQTVALPAWPESVAE